LSANVQPPLLWRTYGFLLGLTLLSICSGIFILSEQRIEKITRLPLLVAIHLIPLQIYILTLAVKLFTLRRNCFTLQLFQHPPYQHMK